MTPLTRRAIGVLLALLVAAFGALVLGTAHAAEARVEWTAPTQRTDGTPLTNLAGFRIYYGTSSTNLTQWIAAPGATTRSAVVKNLIPGTWYFAATAIDADGLESAQSALASKVIQAAPPMPPTIVTVAVVAGVAHVPAYGVLQGGARSSAVAGFVPVGVACAGPQLFTYRGKAYHAVPRDAVRWWATSPTDRVAAPCGPAGA